jgi:multidrug efflux system membrane fusion protein
MEKPGWLGKALGGIVAIAIVAGAVALGWEYLRTSEANPASEDAVVQANLINISSTVPGRIIEIAVKDNARVKKGDLLFAIDPVPYELAVAQAKADLGIAEAALSAQERTIRAETSNAAIAVEQATRAQVNLDLATQTLDRAASEGLRHRAAGRRRDDGQARRHDQPAPGRRPAGRRRGAGQHGRRRRCAGRGTQGRARPRRTQPRRHGGALAP